MSIGSNIKQLRTLYGLTQEELANRCDLTKGYISQIENDNERQGIYTIIKQIANARNGIKFYQQAGDVGELQAKNLAKSAARLSASTTIRLEIDNILTYLGEYMETKDKEKLKEEIKKNLTVPETDLSTETEKVLNDEANNAIDILFENF